MKTIDVTIRALSPELQKIAENDLNEVPGRIQEDLQHLKDWIDKQPHLKCRKDDQWLLTFLRGCKFSLERTKEKIDQYYTMRTMVPEIFANRDPFLPAVQEYLRLGVLVPLKNNTDLPYPKVIFSRFLGCTPEKLSFTEKHKVHFMFADMLLNEDDTMLSGCLIIQDLHGYDNNYAKQIAPTLMKKIMMCIQQMYPLRMKGIHLINAPPFYETIYNMSKMFFSKKISERLHIYSGGDNYSYISKIIPHSMIPREYGGGGDSLNQLAAEWKSKFESRKDWFTEEATYCSNESMRPGKGKTASEMFGIEGSFRKLDVD